MGNIQVRKRKSMTLKNEFSFMGTVHEASNNARNDDESNTYALVENILVLILPEYSRWLKDITHRLT